MNGLPGQQPPAEQEQKKSRCDDCTPDCAPDCDLPCGCDLLIAPLLLLPPTGVPRPAAGPAMPPRPAASPGLSARAGVAVIRGYQRWLSPRLPTRCRMVPTCSQYGLQVVRRHGLAAGSRLIADRIRRCGATHGRGVADPAP